MKKILMIMLLSVGSTSIYADADGKGSLIPYDCESSVYSSLGFICDIINDIPGGEGLCKTTVNTCAKGSQELFTGLNIELASSTNIKNWTGFGSMGELYQLATVCMLKDLNIAPMTSTASASLALGNASIEQVVGFLSFDKDKRILSGFHHAKICAPVIGCMDAFTQKFDLIPVVTDTKASANKVGDYQIYGSFGLDYQTEGLAQAVNVTLPVLEVDTPYGQIAAKPEFNFGRAAGAIVSPYNSGNTLSLLASPLGNGRMEDLYGRNPGMKSSQAPPYKLNLGDRTEDNSIKGWISQLALGSRDMNPKTPIWTPIATEKFPLRPDTDTTIARNAPEKTPNSYMGANVKVSYSPTDLIPEWIRNSGFISISFSIYAQPKIDTTFASQFQIIETETAKLFPPYNDYRPNKLDQYKSFKAFNSSSAAARFALDAGVDLNIHLHVPLLITDIDEDLVDIHPRTTVLEKIDAHNSVPKKMVEANSQGSQVLATNKFFQKYDTTAGSFVGLPHIQACLAKATPDGKLPSPPTYTPGNPSDLTKEIAYPCNVCVGMNDKTFTDKDGKAHTLKGFVQTYFPADESTRPVSVQWKCDQVYESGCYDMCKYDPATKHLTVIETALEILAKGEAKKMPERCR